MRTYIHTTDIHNQNAASVLVPILMSKYKPSSVVDFGCGLGNWLLEFKSNGVKHLKGYEFNIDPDKLVIDTSLIEKKDLTQLFNIDNKFDLAICLEVAEHLPETAADKLIESITNHSDVIIFSAALPFQGGQNHINEQSFMYWVEKFNKYGYECSEQIRREIWDNKKVDWWYKQNIFVAKKMINGSIQQEKLFDAYHPGYVRCIQNLLEDEKDNRDGKLGIVDSFKIFLNAFLNKLR